MIDLGKLWKRAAAGLIAAGALLLTACSNGSWSETAPDPIFSAPVFTTPEPTEKPENHPGDGVFTLNYAPGYSMNPFVTSSEANRQLCGLLYMPMVSVAPGFRAEPGVFSGWSDESGVIFRFDIQEDLRFSDGSAVRNWDVVYSLNRAGESGSHYASRLSCVAEAYVDGDQVVVRLKYANPSFPLRLDIPVVKEGSAYTDLPVGSGPYVLVDPANNAHLEVNVAYPDAGSLQIRTIALSALPQEDLSAALSAGTVDMLLSDVGADSSFLIPGDTERRYLDTSVLHFLRVDPNSEALADPDRRRLVSAALNRNSIASLLGGTATILPINTASGVGTSAWIEALTPKDLAAFEVEILTEDYDGDGILEYFVGGEPTPFTLRLLCCSDSSASTLAASRIRADLQNIGILVETESCGLDELRQFMRSGRYDLSLVSVRLTSDFDLCPLLCSDGSLYCGGCSTDLQQAAVDFRSAAEADRAACAETLCSLLAQECPILPLCFSRTVLVSSRGAMQGMEPTWTDPYRRPENWIPGEY